MTPAHESGHVRASGQYGPISLALCRSSATRAGRTQHAIQGSGQGCVPAREDVAVGVHRDADDGVLQPFRDLLRVRALDDQQRGARVPQVMEAQVCLLGQRPRNRRLEPRL
jgi:hypothetical protein